MRRLSALLAAGLFAFATLTPAAADAQERGRRHHDRGYDRGHYSEHYDHRRRHRDDDDGEAVVAGVIGLVLGLAIASAASERRERADGDRYYERDDGYYQDDGRSAYERDYSDARPYDDPPPAPQCTRRERQWDRYANRYVTVDVPC
jgi:hypothetical protein